MLREEFIPEEAQAGYFVAANFIAVTHISTFDSQSGALNVVARAARRVLLSCGEGPLKSCRQHAERQDSKVVAREGYIDYDSLKPSAKIISQAIRTR